MKKLILILLLLPSFLLADTNVYRIIIEKQQKFFDGRSFTTSFWNTGIFNQNLGLEIAPSLQWPVNSGKFLGLSAGLCIGAYVDGTLRLANASYTGEYVPGYNITNNGITIPKTSDAFHIYKVTRGDNAQTNPDYANWGSMILRNIPYDDVNNNGIFDNGIDIPGVKGAYQTMFVCLTDGFAENHNISEGFSGGTAPLFAELRISSWIYDNPGYQDMQFIKFRAFNCNNSAWDKVLLSLFYHPQIGDSLDDYIGCDTVRRLGFAYNKDNQDGSGDGNSYGLNPPAVGMKLLLVNGTENRLSSFHSVILPQAEECPPCEEMPNTPLEAYNFMRGAKKDNTPWLDASQNPPRPTKYLFSGDPETETGWNEPDGVIGNCLGNTTGQVITNQAKRKIFIMSVGSDNYSVPRFGFTDLYYVQLTARGSSNKNSVTRLKLLSDKAQELAEHNFVIGINQISTIIPEKFFLYQNFPNPFNPSTKIKFEIPQNDFVGLTVYDIRGKIVEELVNARLSAGIFETNFSAKNLSSGIYFYQLKTSSFVQTKKMTLVK